MKKLLIITALVGGLGLVGYQAASANGYGPGNGPGFGGGYGYCGNYGYGAPGVTGDNGNFTKFNDETADLRKDLTVKQAELDALYRQETPDSKKIAALTGDLVDLQNKLDKVAGKYDLNRGVRGPGYAMGYGMGYGMGFGPGSMMGYYGNGYGRNMMNW